MQCLLTFHELDKVVVTKECQFASWFTVVDVTMSWYYLVLEHGGWNNTGWLDVEGETWRVRGCVCISDCVVFQRVVIAAVRVAPFGRGLRNGCYAFFQSNSLVGLNKYLD